MKTIDELNIHEELVVQEDDFSLAVAFRVPGGIIYKFFESKGNTIFVLSCTEFVPYNGFKDNENTQKQILNS